MHMGKQRLIERKDEGGPSLAAEVKKVVEPLMTGFEEFKKTNDQRLAEIEKKGTADPLTLAKLGQIEADLARTEEVNQKLVAIEREAKAAVEREQELRETIDRLELKLKRPLVGGEDLKLQRKATHATWARGAVLSSMGGNAARPTSTARCWPTSRRSASRSRSRTTRPAATSRLRST